MFTREHEDERLVIAVNAGDYAATARFDEGGIGMHFRPLWGSGGIVVDGDELQVALAPRGDGIWQAV